jgi:transposase InsO family protein
MASSHRSCASQNATAVSNAFIRTLKEQLLWVKMFQNVAELRYALAEFRELYNQRWIVRRLDYLTPAQAR